MRPVTLKSGLLGPETGFKTPKMGPGKLDSGTAELVFRVFLRLPDGWKRPLFYPQHVIH